MTSLVPYAPSPWNEIVPHLWMGGHDYQDGDGGLASAVVRDEFDIVISLFRRDGHGPPPRVEHHHVAIPDAPLSPEEIGEVCRLADLAAAAVTDCRSVLVRCRAGYNRSGLVVARTLTNLGYSPDDAIFLIRRRRSKYALHNRAFVDYIASGLDIARLLNGLEPPS